MSNGNSKGNLMTQEAVPYFLAEPAAPNGGGVVLCSDAHGLEQFDIRLAERFAKEGYWAIAPDLYFRFGGADTEKAHAGDWHYRIDLSESARDAGACAAVLRQKGARSVAVLGFCMGGSVAYAAGSDAVEGIDAIVPFYGVRAINMPPSRIPLLAFYGGKDEWIPAENYTQIVERHPGDVVVYPEAGHSFMKDSQAYPNESSDAWNRTLDFFSRTLTSGAAS
jgi:carboxymethylenebutenolidase